MEKCILIVGASSSLGNEIISKFKSPSTQILATYCSNCNIKRDKHLLCFSLDLEISESIDKFLLEILSIKKHIDIVIFLSGILPGRSLKEYDISIIDKVITVNFTGQAKVIKGLLPILDLESQIIMMSSISAQRGSYDPIYAATKGAILSFVKSIANGLEGIRVNAIAPGLIEDSGMYHEMPPHRREFHRSQTLNKKLLKISDLADVIYDITKNHWKSLNGACIDLNGGQYVR